VFQTTGAGSTVITAGVQITNNIADGASGSGGGILNLASVSITGATITGNRANRAGGGIEAGAGTSTTLTSVTLSNNNAGVAPAVAAPGNGGGLHVTMDGDVTITDSTIMQNVAALEGGGLWNGSGQMDIGGNTSISGNVASGAAADDGGGGVFQTTGAGVTNITGAVQITGNTADGLSGSGGGILNLATLNVSGAIISGNVANRAGGGIEAGGGTTTALSNVTLNGNSAGALLREARDRAFSPLRPPFSIPHFPDIASIRHPASPPTAISVSRVKTR
jgi:hypothetical protein